MPCLLCLPSAQPPSIAPYCMGEYSDPSLPTPRACDVAVQTSFPRLSLCLSSYLLPHHTLLSGTFPCCPLSPAPSSAPQARPFLEAQQTSELHFTFTTNCSRMFPLLWPKSFLTARLTLRSTRHLQQVQFTAVRREAHLSDSSVSPAV